MCRLLRVAVGLAAKGFRVPSLRAHVLKEGDKQICSVFAPGNFKKTENNCLLRMARMSNQTGKVAVGHCLL